MSQLKQLERGEVMIEKVAPPVCNRVTTPLVYAEWASQLKFHPDIQFRDYILEGIINGFHIGFDPSKSQCVSAKRNMRSALQHSSVVEEYLEKEISMHRIVGPLGGSVVGVHINKFGVIPKNHQPGKWRIIVDLSYPDKASVNDGISQELCSLSYVSVDDAVKQILELGPGTMLAKLDVQSAYRIVPVHPADRWLLGMSWNGQTYIDTVLPFGLRSAPIIFTAVADALQWIIESNGVQHIMHYLDDYLLLGPPDSSVCERALETTLTCCQNLGVPVADHKTEGPSTSLVFLGIEVDTVSRTLRLPSEKLCRLQQEIKSWVGRRSCRKKALLSLIGQLQHACCVVQPGRTFLRRMIDLSTTAKKRHHRIRLNRGFRSDLCWWAYFLSKWNGVSMMTGVVRGPVYETITSDASGSWGCGAYTLSGEWFQLKWPRRWNNYHITVKELLPIVLAVAIWGKRWQGRSVQCRCDNAAVVAVLRSGWCKNRDAMHLLRGLHFFLAAHQIRLISEHIKGVRNRLADALSRNNHDMFLSELPYAQQVPTTIPRTLRQLLVDHQVDWMSRAWRDLLSSTLIKD